MTEKKKLKTAHSPKSEEQIEHTMKLLAAPKSMIPVYKEKPPRKPSRINTPMETHHFYYSQLGLLAAALLFLGGMYWVLNNDNYQTKFVDQYLPVTIKQASSGLEIKNPDDELLTFSSALIISGSTTPKASVIIAVAGAVDTFDAIESDGDGNFQKSVTISPGLNRVEISSIEGGESRTVVRTVYYSEEQLQ